MKGIDAIKSEKRSQMDIITHNDDAKYQLPLLMEKKKATHFAVEI